MTTKSHHNPTEYAFDLVRLTEILLEAQGVKTGLWAIEVNFGISQARANKKDTDMNFPAMIVVAEGVRLVAVNDDSPLLKTGAVVDASKIQR